MVRAALGRHRHAVASRADPHDRRPHHRPAAGRSRRQGAVHQGDRRGAALRRASISPSIRPRTCRRRCPTASSSPPACRAPTVATPSCRRARRASRDLPQGAVRRHGLAPPRGAGAAAAAGPQRSCPCAAMCETRLQEARRRRGRRHAAGDGRADAARPRRPRHRHPRRRRLAAGAGAGDDRDHGARRRTQPVRDAAGQHRPRATAPALACRARLPRRSRRLLPHADRRARRDRRRAGCASAASSSSRTAASPTTVERDGPRRRRRSARRRCRQRARPARRRRISSPAKLMRLLVTRPEPDASATARAAEGARP